MSNKKVVIIGDGAVGSSYAYTLVMQDLADEIVLVDVNKDKTVADSLDLAHAVPFANLSTKFIYSGDYKDARNADLVVITANAPAAKLNYGDSRLALLEGNIEMIKDITKSVVASGFRGIFLVASNPVDIITRIVAEVSGFPKSSVIGTGTLLDTARLKSLISGHLDINPNHINGYVIGEHGESSFTAWSSLTIGCLSLMDYVKKSGMEFELSPDGIEAWIRQVGFDIFEAKGNTSYGIASSLATITRAIFKEEYSILPVSAYLDEAVYGEQDLYIGLPSVINSGGIGKVIELSLNPEEIELFKKSSGLLKSSFEMIKSKL